MATEITNKLKVWVILALLSVAAGNVNAEESGTSYVDVTKSFLEIKDINRQAEVWAMCAATYDTMAEFLSEAQPARSKQLKQLANGADVAVIMSMFFIRCSIYDSAIDSL